MTLVGGAAAHDAVADAALLGAVPHRDGAAAVLVVGVHPAADAGDARNVRLGPDAAAQVADVGAVVPAARGGVLPQLPHLQHTLQAPLHPRPVGFVRAIAAARQLFSGARVELLFAAVAVTHRAESGARPAVGVVTVRIVAPVYLFDDAGHVPVVVGAEHAGAVQLRVLVVAPGGAGGVALEPIRMRFEHFGEGVGGVQPGDHANAGLLRGGGVFPEKIAVAEKPGTVVQRDLARVERHDSAAACHQRLDAQFAPISDPLRDVKRSCVGFVDVELRHAAEPLVPARLGGLRLRWGGCERRHRAHEFPSADSRISNRIAHR